MIGFERSSMEDSPLRLSFLGDAVFELLVREALVRGAAGQPRDLHKEKVRYTNAAAQAKMAQAFSSLLTAEEADVFRRGKNAVTRHRPTGCTRMEYSLATALECLFGWLWHTGQADRCRALFDAFMRTKCATSVGLVNSE
jgi:ribonuclease-3 family protein